MRRWIRIIGRNDGAEIAEAALVLPIAFMVLLAIYWFGRAFNIYGTINHAAREGVRAGLTNTCASCGNAGPNVSSITTGVSNALIAAHLDPSATISETVAHTGCNGAAAVCSTPAGPANLYVCTNVQLAGATPPSASGVPACGLSVDFQYPYQMVLPFTSISNQGFKFSAHVQMRTEQ